MSNVSDTLKNVDSVAAQHGEFHPSTPGTAPAAKTVCCSTLKESQVEAAGTNPRSINQAPR